MADNLIVGPGSIPEIWIITKESDSSILEVALTQHEAYEFAREWLEKNGGGEITVQGEDGKFRYKNTIYPGNDPKNIKG